MNYNLLGKSSLRVSEIGFGCMSLGVDDAGNATIINRAIDLGINFFDTADIYANGANEISVGKVLRNRRKDVLIATKVGNVVRADGKGLDWNPSKKHILESIEKSLGRLGTDYVDLYQLHGGTIDDPIDEMVEAFELLQQQGKIRYYGISSIRPNVIREYINRSQIVSVMMQYSLLDRRPEETCLRLLAENNIGVLARGSLAKGLLGGKPAAPFLGYSAQQVENVAAALNGMKKSDRTQAQTALRFVLRGQAICSAIAGIRTLEQLEEVARASSAPALTDKEWQTLRDTLIPEQYQDHR